MIKYLFLYFAFFRASLTADVEFRANFITKIVTDIFWYAAQIISFEVLFNYTPHIGDWDRGQTRIFLGVLFLIDAIYMVMFSNNLDMFSDSISKGNLDLLLTKPVNSQFIISCQRVSTAHLGNLALGLGWLIWSILQMETFSWMRVLWLVPMIPAGVVVFYSIRFLFSSLSVIFTRAENLQYLWYHLYKLGMRPDNIYYPWLKYVILTIVPVGLIASVPARLVLGNANLWLVPWTIFVAAITLLISSSVWKKTLKLYTSASS